MSRPLPPPPPPPPVAPPCLPSSNGVCSAAGTSRPISRWFWRGRRASGGSACGPTGAWPGAWTTSGTTAYRSPTPTGTKTSQVRWTWGGGGWGCCPGNSSVRLSPDSGDGSCVAMAADKIGGFWDDKRCSEKFFFFCEKSRPDISPPTKAPTLPPSHGCADGWTAMPHFRSCYQVGPSTRRGPAPQR